MSERASEPAKLLDRSGITLRVWALAPKVHTRRVPPAGPIFFRQGFWGWVSALRAVELGGRAII